MTSTFVTESAQVQEELTVEHAVEAAETSRAVTTPVLAANRWNSNAELIADAARLGYLRATDTVLDPTYERGTWWKVWRPPALVALNRDVDGTDFRNLGFSAASFDAIAYDPPYCAKGGRTTSGIEEMDNRYGQEDCPATPELLQELINDGLTEMVRLVKPASTMRLHETKPNGIILVKAMDYVSSGRLFDGSYQTYMHARSLGLQMWDRFYFVTAGGGPQPKGRAQQHARNNISTLFVFRRFM